MEFKEILLNLTSDKEKVENFLKEHSLDLEEDVEYTLVLEEEDKIIATGSVAGNILKCIAIDDDYQGQGLSNKIVSKLIEYEINRGIFHLFIFTKPIYKNQMIDFGFKEVVTIENYVTLLDNNISNITKFIENIKIKVKENLKIDLTNKNGARLNISAIVMNANPFTKGHKYLVEYAAKKSDLVFVFVVKENKSRFPFDIRYECVQKGLEEFSNVLVFDGGEYIISAATFPTYFIKDKKIINDVYSKLDATIFARYIAEPLGIKTRYMGEEPLDIVTKNYNENVKKILNNSDIQVEIIPRKFQDNYQISASFFRKLIDEKKYEEAKKLVPETTFQILKKYSLI